ncbi:hypothetical protein QQF64_015920 [Cirrhinus molitorella]|uniref:Uncharacterized protein n=1 Tax=Cirrhinus molitorella TaxID=172907 RepID=A0ABR3LNW3_9TELE
MSLTFREDKHPSYQSQSDSEDFNSLRRSLAPPARVYAGSIFGSDPLKLCGTANWSSPTQGSSLFQA